MGHLYRIKMLCQHMPNIQRYRATDRQRDGHMDRLTDGESDSEA